MTHKLPFAPGKDEPFIFSAYCCARREEVADWGMGAPETCAFLRMQHDLQLASYRQSYPQARWEIVVSEGERVGYVCSDRGTSVVTLADIALLAHARGRGIGTELLRSLQREAEERALKLRLSVRPESPARRLYERLGFTVVHASETNLRMEWSAQAYVLPSSSP